MLCCHPTLSFKGERQRQILLKLKILRDSANSDRFHHNHFNLDIGLSERPRPIFGTLNRKKISEKSGTYAGFVTQNSGKATTNLTLLDWGLL